MINSNEVKTMQFNVFHWVPLLSQGKTIKILCSFVISHYHINGLDYFRNLPEVKSTHKILRVPTVSARFGTDPFFWNWGMETFVNFLPAVRLVSQIKHYLVASL